MGLTIGFSLKQSVSPCHNNLFSFFFLFFPWNNWLGLIFFFRQAMQDFPLLIGLRWSSRRFFSLLHLFKAFSVVSQKMPGLPLFPEEFDGFSLPPSPSSPPFC